MCAAPAGAIAWPDATAYCDWLKERAELPVRLPRNPRWRRRPAGRTVVAASASDSQCPCSIGWSKRGGGETEADGGVKAASASWQPTASWI